MQCSTSCLHSLRLPEVPRAQLTRPSSEDTAKLTCILSLRLSSMRTRPIALTASTETTLRTMVIMWPGCVMRPGRDMTRMVTAPTSCVIKLHSAAHNVRLRCSIPAFLAGYVPLACFLPTRTAAKGKVQMCSEDNTHGFCGTEGVLVGVGNTAEYDCRHCIAAVISDRCSWRLACEAWEPP